MLLFEVFFKLKNIFRAHIFGQHVAEYMRNLEQEDEDTFKRQFGQYVELGVNADDVSVYRY